MMPRSLALWIDRLGLQGPARTAHFDTVKISIDAGNAANYSYLYIGKICPNCGIVAAAWIRDANQRRSGGPQKAIRMMPGGVDEDLLHRQARLDPLWGVLGAARRPPPRSRHLVTTILIVITNILTRTPVWVFPLIAAVIWLGSLGLRERSVPLRWLFILPAVLLVMSIGNSIGTAANSLAAVAGWVIAATAGGSVGWSTSRQPRSIDLVAGRIVVPGSVIPLLVCIAVVTWRYVFGYLYGRYPELRADGDYALALIVGSALLGAIMAGRMCRYGVCYWQAASAWRPTA